jgi:hypothetical protein
MNHKKFLKMLLANNNLIVIYTISWIKTILQDSSVKIADDEGVSPSSSLITRVSVVCFSPRVMYKILSKTAPN